MNILTLTLAATVVTCAVAPPLRAQRVGQAGSRGRDARCAQAIQAASASHASHRQVDELHVLVGCGTEGARETARAIMATRSEQDIAVLSNAWGAIDRWRDADVMRAALSIARDNGASAPGRVFAVMHLIRLVHPGQLFTYPEIVRGTTYRNERGVRTAAPPCRPVYSGVRPSAVASALPASYVTQIQPVLDQMSEDPSLPTAVRNAAWCGRSPPTEELR